MLTAIWIRVRPLSFAVYGNDLSVLNLIVGRNMVGLSLVKSSPVIVLETSFPGLWSILIWYWNLLAPCWTEGRQMNRGIFHSISSPLKNSLSYWVTHYVSCEYCRLICFLWPGYTSKVLRYIWTSVSEKMVIIFSIWSNGLLNRTWCCFTTFTYKINAADFYHLVQPAV